jgi:deoxycytidylate deaminase
MTSIFEETDLKTMKNENNHNGVFSPPNEKASGLVHQFSPSEESETKHCEEVKKTPKRKNAISWDDYFMSVAFLSAMRSKDPSTQVGACIVNEDKRIVGIGYNGFPRGCSDDELPWDREADSELDTKYPVHQSFLHSSTPFLFLLLRPVRLPR